MAQTITEGLFPSVAGLFATPGAEQQARLQAAGQPTNPLQAVSGNIGFLGERMQQGIGATFGQMPEVDRKRQVFQQLVRNMQQQGVDISTPQGMVQLAQQMSSIPGLEGEALNLRQRAAQMAQQAKMQGLETQFKESQIAKNLADAQKAGRPETIKTPQDFAAAGQELGIPIKPDLSAYSQQETQIINERLNKQALDKAKASAAKLNFEDPASKFKAISEVNTNLKPYSEALSNVINGIQLGIRKDSPFAQKGFETTVGNIFGNQVRAQAEIERLRNSGNLGERITNTLSLFLTGNIGKATKEDQMEVLMSLYELNRNQYDLFADPYRRAAGNEADSVAPLAADRFALPPLPPGKQYIRMSDVVANGLKKGDTFKHTGKVYRYNGDGTISLVKESK